VNNRHSGASRNPVFVLTGWMPASAGMTKLRSDQNSPHRPDRPELDAVNTKGRRHAIKWLALRRAVQLGVLALFLAGPWFGVWIVKGTLASSLTLGTLPLTDPYLLLQSLAARHRPELTAITGALIVLAAYLLVGGRVYCAWVCPVNPVTDAAAWLRRRLGLGTLQDSDVL
jgi:ferredoxin-type protein NapH